MKIKSRSTPRGWLEHLLIVLAGHVQEIFEPAVKEILRESRVIVNFIVLVTTAKIMMLIVAVAIKAVEGLL